MEERKGRESEEEEERERERERNRERDTDMERKKERGGEQEDVDNKLKGMQRMGRESEGKKETELERERERNRERDKEREEERDDIDNTLKAFRTRPEAAVENAELNVSEMKFVFISQSSFISLLWHSSQSLHLRRTYLQK